MPAMSEDSDDLPTEAAYQEALRVAPDYEARLRTAVLSARDLYEGDNPVVHKLFQRGKIVGLAQDVRMKCSFLLLQNGDTLGYMWHLIDESSEEDLARQVLADIEECARQS